MELRQIMTREVQTVMPSASIQSAAQRMADLDVGALPVCENRVPVGMITDRDIVVRAVAAGLDPARTTVGSVMSHGVVCVADNCTVADVARAMAQRRVRRVLVLDDNRRLEGIITLGDLASTAETREFSSKTLEKLAEGCGFGVTRSP